MPSKIDWALLATWAQAISSTVVLFMIYLQIRQANTQLVQNDAQERSRRSWEFIKVYMDEQRANMPQICALKCPVNVAADDMTPQVFDSYLTYFYFPRLHLFLLLNKLVEHQEVDERLLFGYLDDDFNLFIELGLRLDGVEAFKKMVAPKINILLNLWGARIRAGKLLYSVKST